MRHVEGVRAMLREAIELPSGVAMDRISIDCRAATEVDLTFVQLLVAARISARRLSKTLILAAYPDGVFLDTLTRGGFQVAHETGIAGDRAYWFEGAEA